MIPKIVSVANSSENKEAILPPKFCPSCGTSVLKDENKVRFYCPNSLNCPAQHSEKMIFAVTVKDEILDIIDGIPVKQVDELKGSGDDTIFVITAKESSQYEMYQNLLALGIKKIVYLSDDVRCLLTQNVQSEH